MAAGQAECGISFQDALTFAAAAGAPIVSVMAILQHTAQEIAVLDSSTITRPRELDGKTYAGFGYPNEEPTLKSVIKADGGKGTFTTVTLDTAAYEALYAKRADFVITFAAWEGIEAEQRGIKLRTFQFGDYGFPDFYQVVLACDSRWLAAHPDLARAFVGATVRGFELAADDPDGARRASSSRRTRASSTDRPTCRSRASASSPTGGYLRDASGAVGRQTLAEWQGYSGFLFDQGLLAGPDGKPLDGRARLRGAVHERLPAVTDRPRAARPLGTAAPPGRRCSSSPGRPTSASPASTRSCCRRRPASSASLWDVREARRRPPRPDARRGARRVCACRSSSPTLTAIALDRWAPVRRAVEPLLVTSQTIPIVAIAPLFVIWFGFGLLPKVVIVVLVTFFPVTVALLDGFGRVDPEATTLLRSLGASTRQTFRCLRWPSALPSLFTGLRISVVYAVIGAIFGEYVGATERPRHLDEAVAEQLPDRPRLRARSC